MLESASLKPAGRRHWRGKALILRDGYTVSESRHRQYCAKLLLPQGFTGFGAKQAFAIIFGAIFIIQGENFEYSGTRK